MTEVGRAERVYGNRYEIQRKIARGGMADVFLARDQLLDRPVALKVLFAELSVDPTFVERFRREAQNAAKLSHPNIVSVYDWGEDSGTYFIVMEYVDGQSLSQMLRKSGTIAPERAAKIGAEVAAALSFAHRNGVVHRDVKPGNVLIDSRGSVKVTDFGIARARNTTENLTQTGAVMGTATYFSPEQAQGLTVDQRSDVYSLGIVLYEMVAGKPPFQGDNPVTIAYKHVREEPPPLRRSNPSLPGTFEAIVTQAMSKSPAGRYATAEDLRADLERFLRGQPVNATSAIPPAGARGYREAQQEYADSTRAVPPVVPSRPPPRNVPSESRGIAVPLLVFISLVTLLAIGAIVLFNSGFGSGSNKPVTVPDVTKKAVGDAEGTLRAAGLKFTTTDGFSDDVPQNSVISQVPGPGEVVRTGNSVTLTVSQGSAPVSVPDVTNQTVDAARRTLSKAGFTVQTTDATSDSVDKGKVISQTPSGGDSVKKNTSVSLTVSSGHKQVTVPNVQGYTVAGAKSALSTAGFDVSTDPDASDNDIVTGTDPAAGIQVDYGSKITVLSRSTTTTTQPTTTTTEKSSKNNGNGNNSN